ncbi:MAG: DUF167 domain-containing protein [Candidatus Methanomethylophilaceae archaeon]|jgi:uncharacterized protein (TIGR00251 family)
MELSDISRKVPEGLELEIYVSPRSSRSGPEGIDEWRKRLTVRVKAPPLDGKANREVEEIFAEITGMKSEIVNGVTDRRKTVLVRGDPETALKKIEECI